MKPTKTSTALWVLLVASMTINIYLALDNKKQRELAEIHLKVATQKQAELSAFELKFEQNVSVAKAAYARAEAQLEEAKKNLEPE